MTTTSGGGTLSLVHSNALAIPLADQSVHLVVTSPPYFALRDYRTDDDSLDDQLGSEPTPHHFLAALWQVLDECWRVLRDDGSCWVNLGDRFAGSGGHNQNTGGLRLKSRMLLPGRFAHGLIDPAYRRFEETQAGLTPTVDPPQWICRMDVTQSKLNGLPESVTDRVRASHETWFHLTKSERYFAAMDEIREESTPQKGLAGTFKRPKSSHDLVPGQTARQHRDDRADDDAYNALGKLPGSVWEWAAEPLVLPADLPQHFAAFASWPVRRIVLGWSPSGVCVACEQPRRPVCEKERTYTQRTYEGSRSGVGAGNVTNSEGRTHAWLPGKDSTTITGYACACPTSDAPTRPSVVVDPFSGTGTAPIVAAALGRHGVGVDLSWDYHRIARWRDEDGGLRAKALGVDRPERQVPGQLSLLDGAP